MATGAESIQFDKKNPNKGNKVRGEPALRQSLERNGAGRSVVVDKNNRLVVGNQTFAAWKALGKDRVIFVDTDGSDLVVVRRTDLDLEDDPNKKARELSIADNETFNLSHSWDYATLAEVSEGLDLSYLWTDEELASMFGDVPEVEDGVAKDTERSTDDSQATISVGEYRAHVDRDVYLEWIEDIRQRVGFDRSAILNEILSRLGLL